MSNKDTLSTYPLAKLLELWRRSEITETQLLGYLLQHVISLEGRMIQVEKQRPQPPAPPMRA